MSTTIETTIQLGDPFEHRGVVIAPLYPRRSPAAAYVTAEEAMPFGFRVTEVDAEGSVPELLAGIHSSAACSSTTGRRCSATSRTGS